MCTQKVISIFCLRRPSLLLSSSRIQYAPNHVSETGDTSYLSSSSVTSSPSTYRDRGRASPATSENPDTCIYIHAHIHMYTHTERERVCVCVVAICIIHSFIHSVYQSERY